jgi:hypothetical protein
MQEVKFAINPTLSLFEDGFNDEEIAKVEDLKQERLGYFQSWGFRLVRKENTILQESVGIVIEAETGKVYMILPNFIIFQKCNASMFD